MSSRLTKNVAVTSGLVGSGRVRSRCSSVPPRASRREDAMARDDHHPRPLARWAAALCALVQVATAPLALPPPAQAILKGNPNAKIPRNPEAALRRSTPVVNREVRDVQAKLEEVAALLRIPQRKQWDKMQRLLEECREQILSPDGRNAILRDVASPSQAESAAEDLSSLDVALGQCLRGVAYKDASYCGKYLNAALGCVNSVALSQVAGLPYSLPVSLSKTWPVLTGRAQLRLTIRKNPKSNRQYVLDQETRQDTVGELLIDLDGFSAPLTSGQLLSNAKEGRYDGVEIAQDLNGTALLVNAKARGALAALRAPPVEVGETGETAEAPGAMDDSRRALPLEIFQTGEFEPFYNQQLDVLDMEYPILPMSIFGAVVMSHDANDANRSSDRDWFIYKFDESMGGLAGLSFDEGQFSVVGYVTGGSDLIGQVEGGDTLEKVEILSGGDRLRQPA